MSANPLHRLKIRMRLLVIMIVFMIPIAVLLNKYNGKMMENIDFTNMEITGTNYVRPLVGLLDYISDYQLSLVRVHANDSGAEKDMADDATKIDALLGELEKVDAVNGQTLEVAKEGFAKHHTEGMTAAEIAQDWQALKGQATYQPESYSKLLAGIYGTINHVAETSGIILDIDLDSFYLMDATFAVLPDTIAHLAQTDSDHYSLLVANAGYLPAEHRSQAAISNAFLNNIYFARTKEDIENSIRTDAVSHGESPTLKSNLEPKFAAYVAAKSKLSQALMELADGKAISPSTFAEIAGDMNDSTTALNNTAFDEMVKLFEIRLVDLRHDRFKAVGITAVLVVIAFLLFLVVSGSIAKPIQRVQEALGLIAEGDTDMEVPVTAGKDEISQLYQATEKLRETVEDAFRLKQMVEDMPTNLATINVQDEFKVNYANKEFRKTVRGLESELGITSANLIGTPSDKLKLSSQSLGKVTNLPIREKMQIGKEVIDVNATPMRNKKGDYVGAMVTWNLVTRQAELANSFESSVKSVVTSVSSSSTQMRSNAEKLSSLADDTKQRSGLVATAAVEAAQTANQVAAAAEELTAAIAEISAQVQKASSVSSQASTQAGNINDSMHMLVDKSNRVGEVIQFITNIASQINLLALNATIESARAGEAGRGFAVVASEVKNLANQTAKATEEIVQQVQSMQEATHQAVESVTQIIGIINEISASTAGVAAAVEEQSAATNEISRNIAHTAAGTNQISQNIGAVEQGADETGVSSREVLSAATALNDQASTLSKKVDEFLVMVRE